MKFIILSILLLSSIIGRTQLEEFYNEYYLLEEEDGGYVLRENCWSMQLDKLSISAVHTSDPHVHSIVFNSFHAENYRSFYTEKKKNGTVIVKAYVEDDPENVVHTFEFKKSAGIISVYHKNYSSISFYLWTRSKLNPPFYSCEDGGMNNSENESDEAPQPSRQKIRAMLDPLFTGEEIEFDKYSGPAGFDFYYPGPGVSPQMESLKNASSIYTNSFFQNWIKGHEDSWTTLPFFRVEKEPMFCVEDSVKKGIYVFTENADEGTLVKMRIYLEDGPGDSNGMKIIFMIKDQEQDVLVIQLNECSA